MRNDLGVRKKHLDVVGARHFLDPGAWSGSDFDAHNRIIMARMTVGGCHLGHDLDEAILTAEIDTVADDAVGVRILPVISGLFLFVHFVFGSPFYFLMSARDGDKEERSSAGSNSLSPRWCNGKKLSEELVEGALDAMNGTIQKFDVGVTRFELGQLRWRDDRFFRGHQHRAGDRGLGQSGWIRK